jgi:uncharacterized protein (UPF0332 family)
MTEELSKVITKAEDFYDDAVYLFKGERYGAVVNRRQIQKCLLRK